MEDEQIKPKLQYGGINLNLDDDYRWNSNLSTPERNLIFRFKWYNSEKADPENNEIQFLNCIYSGYYYHDCIYIVKWVKWDDMEVDFNSYKSTGYNLNEKPYKCSQGAIQNNIPECEHTWIIVQLYKHQLYLLDGNSTLVRRQYNNDQVNFKLEFFNNVTYNIKGSNTTSGWIENFEVFQDVYEYQVNDIILGKKIEICQIPEIQDQYILPNQYYNILEQSNLKYDQRNGWLNIGGYSNQNKKYIWNSHLPQAQENIVFRFYWQIYVRNFQSIKEKLFITNPRDLYTFTWGKPHKNDLLDIKYTDDGYFTIELQFAQLYVPTTFEQFYDGNGYKSNGQWIIIKVTKDSLEYYDGKNRLMGQQKGTYNLNMFEKHQVIISPNDPAAGFIKNLEVFYDLQPNQMTYALSKNEQISVCEANQVITGKCCYQYLLEDSKLDGVFYDKQYNEQYSFNLFLTLKDQQKLDTYDYCFTQQLKDIQGNDIQFQKKSNTDISITLSKSQIKQYCYYENMTQQICKFNYIVSIGDLIQVSYMVEFIINSQKYSTNISFKYGAEPSKLNLQNDSSDFTGTVLNRNFTKSSNKDQYPAKIILYSSHDFNQVLDDKTYQYGDFIYAQLQPYIQTQSQGINYTIEEGMQIKFIYAKLDGNVILPFDISYNSQGQINLSFNPKKFPKSFSSEKKLKIIYQPVHTTQNLLEGVQKDPVNCDQKIGNCCVQMLQESEIKGSGDYKLNQNQYIFNFDINFLMQPECVTGQFTDQQGNIIQNSNSLQKPSISLQAQQISQLCSDGDYYQTCKFSYSLQIQQASELNFDISSQLLIQQYYVESKFNKLRSFLNQRENSNKLKINSFPGQVYTKQLSIVPSSTQTLQSKLVFFDSPLFKYQINDGKIQGNNIYAQIQVQREILDLGFQIQYLYASLNRKNIDPYDTFYTNEGYLNLSFDSDGYLKGVGSQILDIQFKLVNQQEQLLQNYASQEFENTIESQQNSKYGQYTN